jgi:hypothetical protein
MAHWLTVNYRESYGMFACSGILFNHESPRRGEIFVTRKITRAVAAIAAGRQACVVLGNLDAQRDWGHARDYVRAMWAMLQIDAPEDFVIATGETRSVRVFCEAAFAAGGFGELRWEGAGVEETGVAVRTGATVVRVSERYHRPAEVDLLIGAHAVLRVCAYTGSCSDCAFVHTSASHRACSAGDPAKAVAALGFNPRATSFEARACALALRSACSAAQRSASHPHRRIVADIQRPFLSCHVIQELVAEMVAADIASLAKAMGAAAAGLGQLAKATPRPSASDIYTATDDDAREVVEAPAEEGAPEAVPLPPAAAAAACVQRVEKIEARLGSLAV